MDIKQYTLKKHGSKKKKLRKLENRTEVLMKTMYQNVENAAKTQLRDVFISLNIYIRKEKGLNSVISASTIRS